MPSRSLARFMGEARARRKPPPSEQSGRGGVVGRGVHCRSEKMADEKEVIVTDGGGGGGGVLIAVVLLVALVVVLFLLFGRGLMGGETTDINADVKIDAPATK
jgi:hypothetical protein